MEIKFRGKRIDNGEWVYGDLIHNTHDMYDLHIDIGIKPSDKDFPYKVIPETVGIYTTLNDKNGNEIYKGDKYKMPSGQVIIIDWYNGGFGYFGSGGDFIGFSGHSHLKEILKGEVIGNIHENKEVLNAE